MTAYDIVISRMEELLAEIPDLGKAEYRGRIMAKLIHYQTAKATLEKKFEALKAQENDNR